MNIVAEGKLKREEQALFQRYQQRLKSKLKVTELREGGTWPNFSNKEFLVALDIHGDTWDSEKMAAMMFGHAGLTFLIGGANGLPEHVLAKADCRLSFGRVTWPHQLVRVMLVEQIYRGECIHHNHPYHK